MLNRVIFPNFVYIFPKVCEKRKTEKELGTYMEITQLKGKELDRWLEEERKKSIIYLEEYYKTEKKIDETIQKIQHLPNKRYLLIKNSQNRVYVQGNLDEKVLRILLHEGYHPKLVN